MKTPRIIPTLLLQNKRLVKTIRFRKPRYIGDPINAVRIFNSLFVDEIILMDIKQSMAPAPIDFEYLKSIVSECFIPICYGGGVTSLEIATQLFAIGIEKLSIQTAAVHNLKLIKQLSNHFGTQSIVGAIDYKKMFFNGHKVKVHNKKRTNYSLLDYAQLLEEHGAGELIINSIDKDGLMAGYDLDMLKILAEKISIPIIACGGAGHLNHMKTVFDATGINAFAAGSLFVYSGKLNAVLINYPSKQEIQSIFKDE